MCAALGNEPDPLQIPITIDDLSWETFLAIECYSMLPELWTGMGTYVGKDLTNILSIMRLNKVEDYATEYVIDTIRYIDRLVAEDIAKRQKQQSKKNG